MEIKGKKGCVCEVPMLQPGLPGSQGKLLTDVLLGLHKSPSFRVTPSTAEWYLHGTQGLNGRWRGQPEGAAGKSQQSVSLPPLLFSVVPQFNWNHGVPWCKPSVSDQSWSSDIQVNFGLRWRFTLHWPLLLGSDFWVAGTTGMLPYPGCFSRVRNHWFSSSNGCFVF